MNAKLSKLLSILLITSLLFAFCSCIPTPDEQTETFQVSYTAGEGGNIVGQMEQTVERGKDASSVTAVADDGYKFEKWSDGLISSTRQDRYVQEDISVVAIFTKLRDPNRITFDLDYRLGVVDNPIEKVIFDKDKVSATNLPVPTREHFTFGGWYLGETQLSDEQGEILVGNEILESDETAIYAKWTANETFTYKVLIVYVTRVQARLQDQKDNWVDVDYTMSAEEEQFFHATTSYMKWYLDEMLDGMVEFQVDEYFTNETVYAESFRYGSGFYASEKRSVGLFAYDIPEMAQSKLMEEYDSVIVSYGLQPSSTHRSSFDGASGSAIAKYGAINFDQCRYLTGINGVTLESGAEALRNFQTSDSDNYDAYILEHYWIETFVHELAHTIETRVKRDTLDEIWYRSDTPVTWGNVFQLLKSFYFEQAPLFGQKVGIPYEVWAGKIAKIRITNTSNDGSNGSTTVWRQNSNSSVQMTHNVSTGKYDYTEALLGEEITITTDPHPGYKLSRWSDGDTNPNRTITVTEDLTLTAIFELADYTITFCPSEGGTIHGGYTVTGSGTIFFDDAFTCTLKKGDSRLFVTATPDTGYRFIGWSNGETSFTLELDFDSNARFTEWFDDTYSLTLIPIFEKIE